MEKYQNTNMKIYGSKKNKNCQNTNATKYKWNKIQIDLITKIPESKEDKIQNFVPLILCPFVFCNICILVHLHVIAFVFWSHCNMFHVFCSICVLEIFIFFLFHCVCILVFLYFGVVFCSICIMKYLYFVTDSCKDSFGLSI